MLGPAYGGAIVEVLNWRWIFWLNVPQSAAIFMALFWLPNRRETAAKVDYLGGMILVGALLVLSLALSRTGMFTFDSPYPFLLAAAGVGLVALLVLVEANTGFGGYGWNGASGCVQDRTSTPNRRGNLLPTRNRSGCEHSRSSFSAVC